MQGCVSLKETHFTTRLLSLMQKKDEPIRHSSKGSDHCQSRYVRHGYVNACKSWNSPVQTHEMSNTFKMQIISLHHNVWDELLAQL
jgi:hypothetical protein